MIFITQLIYIKPGQEEVFNEFERMAIPIIGKYNGELLLRIKPNAESIIECNIEKPYELHFVSFCSEKDFHNFMNDDVRKAFCILKNNLSNHNLN